MGSWGVGAEAAAGHCGDLELSDCGLHGLDVRTCAAGVCVPPPIPKPMPALPSPAAFAAVGRSVDEALRTLQAIQYHAEHGEVRVRACVCASVWACEVGRQRTAAGFSPCRSGIAPAP